MLLRRIVGLRLQIADQGGHLTFCSGFFKTIFAVFCKTGAFVAIANAATDDTDGNNDAGAAEYPGENGP